MAVSNGVIVLKLPKNQDIPRTFTGYKPFQGLDSSTLDIIKTSYSGTVGVPTVYTGGESVPLAKNTGAVHGGQIKVSKAGRNFTFSVPSMLSDFSGVIAKIKSFGYRVLSATRR